MPRVKLFGNLRDLANTKSLDIPGSTVREVLENLCQGETRLCKAILNKSGEMNTHVRILIAGRDIELSQGLDTSVEPDEHLAIFPAISGG